MWYAKENIVSIKLIEFSNHKDRLNNRH